VIEKALAPFGIPVLSEEGREIPYAERAGWQTLWIVDPLDGTKEFVKRNGEFTVNIALVKKTVPVMGVIYVPVQDQLYFADSEHGAYRLENVKKIKDFEPMALRSAGDRLPLRPGPCDPYTIVGSRSHATEALKRFVEEKRREKGTVNFISAGSSLKICRVAEGSADIYPRLAPTMEWDTAAGQAIAEAAGATLVRHDTGERLTYNREELLNPWFVVRRRVQGA
jgi:3'(2'), 5'-bisphosphate nucleotidase